MTEFTGHPDKHPQYRLGGGESTLEDIRGASATTISLLNRLSRLPRASMTTISLWIPALHRCFSRLSSLSISRRQQGSALRFAVPEPLQRRVIGVFNESRAQLGRDEQKSCL
jgi:hypothetical protein